MKRIGKLFGNIILATMVFAVTLTCGSVSAGADVLSDTEENTELNEAALHLGGYMPIEVVEVDKAPAEIVYDCDEIVNDIIKLQESEELSEDLDMEVEDAFAFVTDTPMMAASEWDGYSSKYFYNKLPMERKVVWDALDAICLDTINSEKNYENLLGGISTSAFEDIYDVMEFYVQYKYSNPQFYFLTSSVSCASMGTKQQIWVGAYEHMGDGKKRSEFTEQFKSGINSVKSKVDYSGDDFAVLKSIHDAVCASVVYNHDAVDSFGYITDEENQYTQSAYSTFTMGKTVCAGYTLGTMIICNDAGIDCVGMTSLSHAWNAVRLYDTWYYIDNTWDDGDNDKIYYRYFLKSEATYNDEKYMGDSFNHATEKLWDDIKPVCTHDSTANYLDPGTVVKPTDKVLAPSISVGDKVSIVSATPGATIYYTMDETMPSPADSKSEIYEEAFTPNFTCGVIKAVAVKDGMWDSDVTTFVLEKDIEDFADIIVAEKGSVVKKEFADYKKVMYSEDDVVRIDKDGKITGLMTGKTTVNLQMTDRLYYVVDIEVVAPKFDERICYINKGSKVTLKFLTRGISDKVTFKSNNTKIATVDSKGKVTPKKVGRVKIIAKVQGVTYDCLVQVCDPKLTGSSTVKKGKKITLKVVNGDGRVIKWSSSNKKIATVNGAGVVKGKKKGKVTITAVCNGKKLKKTITVK